MRTPVKAAALALLIAGMSGVAGPALADPAPVSVTVDANAGLATMPGTGLGVNDAIWDSQLGTTAISDQLVSAGVGMVRYPGGSYGDIYHWQDNTAPGGYVAPGTDFDTFMAAVQRTGAQPMLIANYGSGTPQEAAGWVRYANITKGYGARYWTIGNEIYGNGYYGSAWETDDHADKSATAYANGVVAYAQAMKAVDPSIQIGAVLTTPANWPDGLIGSGDSGTWNQTVLSIAGPFIDYVDLHWYPGGSSAADSLTKPDQLDDAMYLAKQQIATYAHRDLGISLTETNVGVGEDTQPGALFLADAYSHLLSDGVFTVDWWDVHNGVGTTSTIAGQTDYGDFGMFSSGTCSGDVCEPALNTPFAPYWGLSLVNQFARPGDQFVAATSSDPLVIAHAARRPNGDLSVLLLNEDPDNARTVALHYAGYAPAAGTPTVTSYLNGGTGLVTATAGSTTSQTVPAYAMEALTLHPTATPGGPAAPGAPSAGAITDRTATVSWTAGAAGTKYEVYRSGGGEAGETSGTSLTLTNLTPGTRYTVNVVARDGSGRVSPPSPPLTFVTGTPAESTCAVRFTDTSDWGNGYVASIDVTNNGPALSGWTLSFDWPRSWQSFSSGWSATWSQTGTTVRATGDALAAGSTTTIGFVAAYSGPDVLPAVFTLNGTVCTTLS